jgi:hypothetical protein
MLYRCRSCKQDVKEVHICGQTPKGAPVVVQYVNRYPAVRRDYMKRFGSQSPARAAARALNLLDKGIWSVE